MNKVVWIVKDGKNADFIGLKDELIACPQCDNVAHFPYGGRFRFLEACENDEFVLGCYKCACEFLVKVT